MNDFFINIKVDREERPDLDQIYQNAHQLLSQRGGGWPLTLFLSPDGTPFYSGTYFPKQPRYGLPGFPGLLQNIAQTFKDKRGEIAAQNPQILAALAAWQPQTCGEYFELDAAPISRAAQQLKISFDAENGGFGGAPKFLHPAELGLLLRLAATRGDEQAKFVATFTLRKMAQGGLYDQLGGGFCRYSVDARWDIPHFEKMLYDNGLLLGLYCDAYSIGGEPFFARVVEQTAGWVKREMQSEHGGYFSSLDADSEHEEGKFYVWQRDEIRGLLSADEYALIAPYYGLDSAPNFENYAWHLRVTQPLNELAPKLHLSEDQALARLATAQAKLFTAREQRIRPGRDEKILASWNGLMIAGMAKAARTFSRDDWLLSAQHAMDFARETLWQNGKLFATHKDGKTHLNAYLDDHAFLLNAALELLQTEFRSTDFKFAVMLADALLERFEDWGNGGFFFTSHDHEALIQRNKTGQDNATPSGNGIAAQTLLRLSVLTGELSYAEAAERCLKLFFPAMQQQASLFSSLCVALNESLQPPSLLVLCGAEAEAWRLAVTKNFRPELMIIVRRGDETDLPPPLAKPHRANTAAWLCSGTVCLPPILSLNELLAELL